MNFRRLPIQFKIVKDYRWNQYNVMYKSYWWSRWKYCRRHAGQCGSEFRYVWVWDTRKAAEVFINQQYLTMNSETISKKEFGDLETGDRVMLKYGYAGTVEGDLKKHTFSGKKMIKIKQDVKKFTYPYFKREEIVEVIKKRTMKIEELKINNYVMYSTMLAQVIVLNAKEDIVGIKIPGIDIDTLIFVKPETLNGVVLSKEFAESLGFTTNDYRTGYMGKDFKAGGIITDFVLTLPQVLGEWQNMLVWEFNKYKYVTLNYVHELQNFFYAITKENLILKNHEH